jgi:adenosylcobinamide-GDP ribazoletransferase
MIARQARLMVTAAGFLTRLPLGRWTGGPAEELNHSSRYFSLVGAGVGLASAAVLTAAAAVLPMSVAVILSVVATVLVTGAFHEDGLADSCDAFGGGRTREEVFRILEDPRIGAFGALGLILAFSLKVASLVDMPLAIAAIALVCAHALSRAACVLVMASGRYARLQGGKTRPVASGARKADAAIAAAIGVLPFTLAPLSFLLAIPITLAACGVMYAYFRARIGGYTGDCLGAMQQVSEIACYLTFLALLA